MSNKAGGGKARETGARAKTALRVSRTATPSSVRDANRSIILNLIRLRQPISRAALSEQTGIYRSNVSGIVEDLIARDLVTERKGKPEGRGRVPIFLSLKADGFQVLGINMRPHKTSVALAGLTGEVKAQVEFSTPSQPVALVTEIAAAARQMGQRPELSGGREIQQVAMSMPGLVHTDSGVVRWLPKLPEYSGFDMASALQQTLGSPAAVDNDCNLGALAELWLSEAENDHIRDFVFLEIGDVGVGAGILLNRELYRGHDGTLAAEFGHMIVDPNGPACVCGRQGCWELFVCDQAAWNRYSPDKHFTTARFERYLDAAAAGDELALAAALRTARYLSLGISNIAFALNPAVIVVAGKISRIWDLVHRTIEEAFASNKIEVHVRPAKLEADEMFSRGAIHLALSQVFARPKLGW